MPDPPPSRRARPLRPVADRPLSTAIPYAELHCRTNYSFLEGASHPDELVHRAAEIGLQALAITDRNSVAGVVRAHTAAKEAGIQLIPGAEITTTDAPAVVLLPGNRNGWATLSQLITLGRRREEKGRCRLTLQDISEHASDLICCVPLNQETQQRYHASFSPQTMTRVSSRQLQQLQEIFPDRCNALLELHLGSDDVATLQQSIQRCRDLQLPLAASNDVHYHEPGRHALQQLLTAVRCRTAVSELGHELFPNGERFLKSGRQILNVLRGHTELLEQSIQIASRCHFSLDEIRYEYPEELVPSGLTPAEHLRNLTWAGSTARYPDGVPERIREMIRHELHLIEELHYEAYFLTVSDLVRFARDRGILCQGRGSAANSVVCFCLGVTSVDPDRIDVLFERFVSRERNEAPDIDVDFEHERREEVLQYLYDRYGRDRAAMTGAVITYRPRSAIRDISKALSFSANRTDQLAGQMDHVGSEDELPDRLRDGGLDPETHTGGLVLKFLKTLIGFPRHLSQHPGGMVISRGRLSDLVPVENASMPGRTVIQWDKDDLDALGLLKIDILSLGMLSAIRRAFELIEQHHGRALTLADIPAEDPLVYDMICKADTMGVFQIESRAQMSMLPRLRPRCFYDLVIEVAIVRPGPIQGDMVHPYLRRRSGEEPVDYPRQEVRDVLHRTLGVPIFQEQAMRLAIVAAGFSPGEADQLRRAMGAWRKTGLITKFHEKLVRGMLDRGYEAEFAERVFQQISGFGQYGFPESHAASFALLVYISAWLRRHHPAVFAAALINSQPMGFYAPAQLVRDAREHGVEIRPPDVNFSHWDCTLEPLQPAAAQQSQQRQSRDRPQRAPQHQDDGYCLRLGLRLIRGLSQDTAITIATVRQRVGRFRSFEKFAVQTSLDRRSLQILSRADALSSLQTNRRTALWDSLPSREVLPLLDTAADAVDAIDPSLPEMSLQEEVVADYSSSGLSLRPHPITFLRSTLQQRRVLTSKDLQNAEPDRRVRVAGLVLMRQRPSTASGITFVTLEDETGVINLVVHPSTWQRFRSFAAHAGVLLAIGRLQREGDIIHVVADMLEDVGEMLRGLSSKSRDFH